jgi:hypothetical protein
MNRIMPVSPTDMSEAARNAIGQNVWPAAAFFKSGVSAPCVALRFEDVPPAMKYVQCGHSTHRRGGVSAAARRNHPFNEPAYGSKPAS